jgi:hypothetical protein
MEVNPDRLRFLYSYPPPRVFAVTLICGLTSRVQFPARFKWPFTTSIHPFRNGRFFTMESHRLEKHFVSLVRLPALVYCIPACEQTGSVGASLPLGKSVMAAISAATPDYTVHGWHKSSSRDRQNLTCFSEPT